MTNHSAPSIPQAFIWRRLHSLTGLWLIVFIISHLFTNSQAALFIGDDGHGFIHAVNSIHDLPYLPVIEILVLAFPILIHLIWGIKYLLSAKYNSFGKTGKTPYLPQYPRNRAYTWQRITSVLLVIGIIAHVVQMRFIEYPESAIHEGERQYLVRVTNDEGLLTLADRLDVKLYNQSQIEAMKSEKDEQKTNHWQAALEKRPLSEGEMIAAAGSFGTAELLVVRDTFKSPLMIVLYTFLVLATCFHAFNGLWTLMITWGIALTDRAQKLIRTVSTCLMVLFSFLGLAAVWLTYWVNLKQ